MRSIIGPPTAISKDVQPPARKSRLADDLPHVACVEEPGPDDAVGTLWPTRRCSQAPIHPKLRTGVELRIKVQSSRLHRTVDFTTTEFSEMPKALKRISRITLRDQVLDSIRKAIIGGQFKASEKIPEEDLASQLGVSRTPIREAIRMLEQQGIVQVRPKEGTYIASFGSEEVKDGLQVRLVLEQLALRQSIERLSSHEWSEHCGRLQKLLDSMFDAAEKMDAVKSIELDIEWHTRMVDASRNQSLSRIWRLTGLSNFIWSLEYRQYPVSSDQLKAYAESHEGLLSVLRTGDQCACAEAIRLHSQTKFEHLDPESV